MYLVRSPLLLRWYYHQSIWRKSRNDKKIYLTFDDGPIPELTPWILDILKTYQVKATFFCVGENVYKYPELFERVKNEGHAIGNHTYNHVKGWKVDDKEYLENIEKCQKLTQTNLFRPPYGRATKSQLNALKEKYDIIMWDVLSGDFDLNLSPERCYQNIVQYTRNGSIIVMHDNVKAIPRVEYALPRAIETLLKKGFEFDVITPSKRF